MTTQTPYKSNERGFTKNNSNASFNKDLMTHHFARIYMMKMEERGKIVSYEEALEATDY